MNIPDDIPTGEPEPRTNPNQATTFSNPITPTQLYWINIAADSLHLDKEELAFAMFDCPLCELTRTAGEKLLQYLARIKQTGGASIEHEHACASCSDTFTCSQQLCSHGLSRYCDPCTDKALGEVYEEMDYRSDSHAEEEAAILIKPQPKSNGRYNGIEI